MIRDRWGRALCLILLINTSLVVGMEDADSKSTSYKGKSFTMFLDGFLTEKPTEETTVLPLSKEEAKENLQEANQLLEDIDTNMAALSNSSVKSDSIKTSHDNPSASQTPPVTDPLPDLTKKSTIFGLQRFYYPLVVWSMGTLFLYCLYKMTHTPQKSKLGITRSIEEPTPTSATIPLEPTTDKN